MTEDRELLRQYAETNSEEAFSELVRRHLGLVYSTALRQVRGNEALAKDVAQTVFIDLARKAASLSPRAVLAGWLYTGTRLAVSKAKRGEDRRQQRERIAASMQETNTKAGADLTELREMLDEAMSKLAAGDRNALLLRFFQGKDIKAVGAAMGVSEDAARMRITRALGRLHTLVGRRGVKVSTAALGGVLATEATIATPAGLAASISAVAVTSASAGAGVTGLLKLLTLTKFKAVIISAILVAAT